jgi:hypothetical protein
MSTSSKPASRYWRRLGGQRVDAGVLDPVVAAVVAGELALPEHAEDLDGLLQHLQAHLEPGPVL